MTESDGVETVSLTFLTGMNEDDDVETVFLSISVLRIKTCFRKRLKLMVIGGFDFGETLF